MKKLFFFRSSAPSNSNNTEPLRSTDKKGYAEANRLVSHDIDKYEKNHRSPGGSFSKSHHQSSDSCSSSNHSDSALRRSRSLSSAAFLGERFEHRNLSPGRDANRSPVHQQHGQSSCGISRPTIPEKQSKIRQFENGALRNTHGSKRPVSAGSPKSHYDSSGRSSNSSSYISSKVVDRYIDGEQHQDKSRPRKTCPKICTGKESGILSSRAQFTAPSSPTDYTKSKSKSHSFREAKGSCLHFTSGDWVESGFGHESPRTLAKNVMERLTQTATFTKASFADSDCEIPITIQDVYCGSSDKCFDPNSDVGSPKSIPCSEPYDTMKWHHMKAISGFHKEDCLHRRNYEAFGSVEIKDDLDLELQARLNEAKARVALFSEELQDDRFLQDLSFDVPTLIQTIRNLSEERMSLAVEVVELMQSRTTGRSSSKEELRIAKAELQLQTRRLEKEKKELQLGLEKEIDRRSSDWSSKLEKIQLEEQRLRERVRELAEQNVLLQREVCSINERESESRSFISCSEQQISEMKDRVEQFSQKNQDLQQNLSEIREKYQAAEEHGEIMKRNFLEKEKECKELHKSITRLLRTCNEQEKTIEGLREGLGGNLQSLGMTDNQVSKLRTEQMRLTGVELSLRKELEVNRQEVDSLRRENISLLGRLKGNSEDCGGSIFRVNKEMNARVGCLQNEALSTLNESIDLCLKVLEFVKSRSGQHQLTKQGVEAIKNSLDGQFIVESDMKLQGLKGKTESLTRSFQTMSTLLQERAKVSSLKSPQQKISPDGSLQLSCRTSEDDLESELKAESLMTRLLREKLYSKELEVEQLQADLATAVRGSDSVKFEVQNSLDNLSCVTHKLKDLEVQMLKKDEKIGQLESQLEESNKAMIVMRGILPKVSQERDLMWEEVKQFSEKNMLLNSEVNMLKKKIDDLDQDILEKEGQITILKDSLGSIPPFDLLDSRDFAREFVLQ